MIDDQRFLALFAAVVRNTQATASILVTLSELQGSPPSDAYVEARKQVKNSLDTTEKLINTTKEFIDAMKNDG